MKSCVLLIRDGHYLNEIVAVFCKARLSVLAVANSSNVNENNLKSKGPDFVISFLNDYILRGALLDLPGINFHPAPPDYPGRGGASFALYDEAPEFGATAHLMAKKVDSGPILAVRRFPVSGRDSCEILFARAEIAAAELLFDVVDEIERTEKLPSPNGLRWLRPPISRAEFEAWLHLDPEKPEEAQRKIRAARHSRYPGPYLTVGGCRFAYHDAGTPSRLGGDKQP